ncbi:si:dkey-100n23.5 isoform X3 [Latimeria chalumnae]|uniref:si:dkey-100n23.5 isoform X3 n=1 Tax=Latimeria chalumnae TaxID=7897 RepID=UPI00313B60E3
MGNENLHQNNDTRCTLFNTHSDDYKCVTIITVKRSSATFSLIGCIFMLFVIWLLRKYNSLAQKMILSLSLAAFFDSIAYVMGEVLADGVLCNFQAWWLTYFDWCSLAWVCCITLNLYLNLVKETRTDRFELMYHIVAWGVPFILSCLPLFGDYYGPAGAWCWITDSHVAWRFGIWYIPLFILIFLMTMCYFRIIYVAKERVLLAEEIKPLKWYPCVYLAVSVFPLINRLHNAFYPSEPVFVLTLLHVLTAPLHGLANSIVFGLDKETWSQLSLTSLKVVKENKISGRKKRLPLKRYCHPFGATQFSAEPRCASECCLDILPVGQKIWSGHVTKTDYDRVLLSHMHEHRLNEEVSVPLTFNS